jgi:two-component system, NtrC family, sensor kinase
VPGKAMGRAAVEIPWLCPKTDSLIALAEAPASLARAAVTDPALSIFLLRFAQPAPEPDTYGLAPGAYYSAFLPETALAFLNATRAGVVPESSYIITRINWVTSRAAEIATALADVTRLVPSEAAASAVRVAPLGWYATASIDQFDAADPLGDMRFASQPSQVQTEVWGIDHAAITRRLAKRWRLPEWVAMTICHLNLPLRVVRELVTSAELFAITQLSIMAAEDERGTIGLTRGGDRSELLQYLRIDDRAISRARVGGLQQSLPAPSKHDPNPHNVALLPKLLRQAGESRRRNGTGLVLRLEEQIDMLHGVIGELSRQVGDRLRDAKLSGLAELAAGAGHEINNPLAIISSNAQRLLRSEQSPERGESLQAIVRQANRIALLLRDLMQFARPPKPQTRTFSATDLVQTVLDDLNGLATERAVQLISEGVPENTWLDGDFMQLSHALAAVVRNAIEASPRDGWVRVSWAAPQENSLVIYVEDSGPGLTADIAEHAFDPFFCGRTSGRTRGLGLSTAWRLLQQNGCDIRFTPTHDHPSRFSLMLKCATSYDLPSLRSA